MPRYAVFFAPAADSQWWDAGCSWLGRDPIRGVEIPQPRIAHVSKSLLAKLTCEVRRYGWHATLKAPFRLRECFVETQLEQMALAFAAVQRPVALDRMQVQRLGDFLALCPIRTSDEAGALAQRCVSYFDILRAAPSAAELSKRHAAGLSARQEVLLRRWGYPYTEQEFRFHLSLTDRLSGVDAKTVHALQQAAEHHFCLRRTGGPLVIDALVIFREEQAGSPFAVWRSFSFGAAENAAGLPAAGRLFFIVGASGVGKDTVLRWARQRMPATARTVFARRTITRPAEPSEQHEAIDRDTFSSLAAAGHFALSWHANGLYYGIRRGIEADLNAGCDVVVNGSREYVPRLQQLFPAALVIWIDADPVLLRARLAARHRESGPALARRLERAGAFAPPVESKQMIRIDNSGPVEVAGQRLLDILSNPT